MKKHENLTKYKYFAVVGLDMLVVGIVYYLTVSFLYLNILFFDGKYAQSISLLVAIYFFYLMVFRIYRSLWQYAEIREYAICGGVSVMAGLTYSLLHHFIIHAVPFSDNLLAVTLISVALVSYRFVYRIYRRRKICGADIPSRSLSQKRVLLVGAGDAGALLLEEIRRSSLSRILPVGFVDDDAQKFKKAIGNVSVLGPVTDIPSICEKMKVDEIYICIPSATLEQRRRILDCCAKTPCPTKILPQFFGSMIRPVKMQENLRDISINDLLNREVNMNRSKEVFAFIQEKTVMVTGGGGSIGSELCRQIAGGKPKKLIIVDIYENNAYEIQQELLLEYGNRLDMSVEIASVRDENKMEDIFSFYRPHLVFHAAAHKHVPLMEHNPDEAVKNNVFGTYHVANLAEKYGVERFVLISTDKAVHPSSFMGATKRLCEKIVQSKNGGPTEFVAVRFGNVLGSNGSVVPLFKKQIEAGGPVTVTHKEMERFFMTISEAVNLVLQAGSMARGGEIFVLNMGDPVKILSLAENMIKMMGFRPYQDINIVFSGLRPGEKLYEELLLDEEGVAETSNQRIFCGHQIKVTREDIDANMEKLRRVLAEKNKSALFSAMEEIIPSYGQYDKNAVETETVAVHPVVKAGNGKRRVAPGGNKAENVEAWA